MTKPANAFRHDMYEQCKLKSYEQIHKWVGRGRGNGAGRKHSSWARIVPVREPGNALPTYFVQVKRVEVCKITPDNMLTMLVSGTTGKPLSNTLSMSLSRLVPVSWARVGPRRYRILATGAMAPGDSWWEANKTAPELFIGLQLNLSTSQFVNAKPDMVQRVDVDTRRIWLRAVRAFKLGMKTRAKLGVIDTIAKQMKDAPDKRFTNSTVDWSNEEYLNLLHKCIAQGRYPKTLLGAIVLTIPKANWGYDLRQQPMAQQVERTVSYVINAHSVELRTRFGVFSDEVNDEKAN